MKSVEVIACSYNYIFDPVIRARFLKGLGISLEEVVLLIDECHNLPALSSLQEHTIVKLDVFRAMRSKRSFLHTVLLN